VDFEGHFDTGHYQDADASSNIQNSKLTGQGYVNKTYCSILALPVAKPAEPPPRGCTPVKTGAHAPLAFPPSSLPAAIQAR
jgi:hypothetical protein